MYTGFGRNELRVGSKPSLKLTMSQQRMKGVEEQIQEDWANREYIELITRNIKKIADFLNSFGRLSYIKTHTGQYPDLA